MAQRVGTVAEFQGFRGILSEPLAGTPLCYLSSSEAGPNWGYDDY